MLATDRLDFTMAAAVIVHRLPRTAGVHSSIVHRHPHAAGLRHGSRKRQGCRNKRARKQQHKQQSGGQAIHGWFAESGFRRLQVRPFITGEH